MTGLKIREVAGWISGYGLGLLTGATALIRRSRMFHPRGICFEAKVAPVSNSLSLFDPGIFEGSALVRLSSAWWKKAEWRDVLGIGIRFTQSRSPGVHPHPLDQDLLFATIQYPWTTPFAPLSTHYHDFFANPYYAVSPFSYAENEMLFKFKLVSEKRENSKNKTRREKLEEALKEGTARFKLQIQMEQEKNWISIAEISLLQEIKLDQEALKFSPFQNGFQVRPRGYVHYLRVGAYQMSQFFRPKHG